MVCIVINRFSSIFDLNLTDDTVSVDNIHMNILKLAVHFIFDPYYLNVIFWCIFQFLDYTNYLVFGGNLYGSSYHISNCKGVTFIFSHFLYNSLQVFLYSSSNIETCKGTLKESNESKKKCQCMLI